jgi:outer membrane protein assembly factor BamA
MKVAAEFPRFNKTIFFFILFLSLPIAVLGQKKISFKDSLDHKIDLSDWVITSKGFIPIPYLITEPALGGIGGALVPVFIKPNSPYLDSIDGKLVKSRAKPNFLAVGAGYTANGTWFVGGGTAGTIKKWRANYRLFGGYADVNMNFYRTFQNGTEGSFEFNIKTVPIYGQFTKQIGLSAWSLGLDYLFLNTTLANSNPLFNTPKEVNSIVSKLGLVFDYDKRDNVFTPNKGFRWKTSFAGSDDIICSDYDFTTLTTSAFYYVPVSKQLTAGFRAEYQQIWGSPPFYMKPFISMRGIPVMRYQGNNTVLSETEWRWDFSYRHSLVGFGGAAKAIADGDSFQDSSWRVSGGAGYRYLLARKLKLRAGIDIARGPEDWAYYIVFGTNWVK